MTQEIVTTNEQSSQINDIFSLNETERQTFREGLRALSVPKKKSISALVETYFDDITHIRENGATWEIIADYINKHLNESQKPILPNTLSQAYAFIKKHISEARKHKKPSYEELESQVRDLTYKLEQLTPLNNVSCESNIESPPQTDETHEEIEEISEDENDEPTTKRRGRPKKNS